MSLTANAQLSKLNLTVESSIFKDTTCYRLCITRTTDTIANEVFHKEVIKKLDSLSPGAYKIQVYKCADPSALSVVKNIKLYADSLTEVTLELLYDVSSYKMDTETREGIIKSKHEVQYQFSALSPKWFEKNSSFKFSSTFGVTVFQWYSFSKHVGFLVGGGVGIGHYGVSNDTTFMSVGAPSKKIYEYYNYLDVHGDVKFRFTPGSQQQDSYLTSIMYIDIGATYNAPLLFKQIARYENSKKISNGNLHQYTDVRTYVNIGFQPVALFAEYRLMDFVMGTYPELPRYTIGIKVAIAVN